MSYLQKDLLNILRCPVTGSRLRLGEQELISEAAGPDGQQLHYPVQDGIAILLPAQSAQTDRGAPEAAPADRESHR
ncbi:Trm112 family protein [Arthrobacter russicus]|uniref:Uncharacterized protein YbaR (Trm112 family) n=1 Tax=Arthrobacter russicus TaxID=172040 RepID=A0ABU1J9G8_9MICC|nr:Trm112 family protein [Arthrobacter russicus]MBQ1444300.1 hypothetical protein [Renibacterium sp.]MDN5669109.1 hypothetical protein [Renibacterium salmoninarum]MDR6269043.1 uncharacterized protein YbaR (Trm112 family) [Arthrobacter russicus]